MNYNIALLKGDGIGPEIVDSAVAVLQKIGEKFHHTFTCTPYLIGGCAIDATGVPLPKETVDGCLASDSVLLGAVGGAVGHSKWDAMPPHLRPEKALLGIREALGLFTNLRPAKLYPALKGDHRQGKRTGKLPSVERSGARSCKGLSGCNLHRYARRQCSNAAGQEPKTV